MGLGEAQTWHGNPDAKVNGSYFVARERESDEHMYLPQAISTCVVASFIEKNSHPDVDRQPIVATILSSDEEFHICLYDCEKDVLLISEPVELVEEGEDCISKRALAILWLVINHK